jgi:hypothetical protein
MIRTIGAIFAASFAAPYIVLLLLWLSKSIGSLGLLSTKADTSALPPDPLADAILLDILLKATTIIGAVVFIISAILVLVLKMMRSHNQRSVIISGGIIGAGLLTVFAVFGNPDLQLNGEGLNGLTTVWIDGVLSGAICGWIYWSIATGGHSKAPVL